MTCIGSVRWKISTTNVSTISELDLNFTGLISSAPVLSSPSRGMQWTRLETRHTQQLLGCVHNRSGAAPRAESCRDAAVVTLINITGASVCLVGCAASRPLDWQLQRDAGRVGTSRLEVRGAAVSHGKNDPDGKKASKQENVYLSGYCMICIWRISLKNTTASTDSQWVYFLCWRSLGKGNGFCADRPPLDDNEVGKAGL